MLHILKLIRTQNLLIIVATQYLMRYAVVEPILLLNNFELQFSSFDFALLVLSTISLTAAGYVINDYFDTKTDIVNRPSTVIVGKTISRRKAMTFHTILNILGVMLGIYVSWKIGLYQLGIIFLVIAGLLWYYSTTYKRQFLIGNILVAFLTALVPLMVVLFEIPPLNAHYRNFLLENKINLMPIFFRVAGFSFFAFLTTLLREIIKDMEDFEGDCAYGRNTVPIILGSTYTKAILISLIAITIGSLIAAYIYFLNESVITIWYFIIGIIIPLIILATKLIYSETKQDYRFAGNFTKIIMLIGLLYSFVIAYLCY